MSILSEALNLDRVLRLSYRKTLDTSDLKTLIRRARKLHRMYEIDASIDLAPTAREKHDAARDRMEARVMQTFKGFGVFPILNGDPRGFPVKIPVARGYGNDFGGENVYGIGL